MRSTFWLGPLLWLAATVAAPVHAHGGMGMGGGMHGHGMGGEGEPGMTFGMVLRGVGLSPAQQEQVRTIMGAHRARFHELFGQLRSANDAMSNRLFTAGPLKLDDLAPQMQQVAGIRQQLVQEGLQVALELRGVLTPEQLAKAGSIATQLQALRQEMKKLLGDGPPDL